MPKFRECRKPECHRLISYDQVNPYCEAHSSFYHPYHKPTYNNVQKKQRDKLYNRFKRDKEANAFYHTKQWRQLSKAFKQKHINTCAICGRTYDSSRYMITDHIVPRKVDKSRQLDKNNLWLLCMKCHYWKTELEKEIYTSKSKIENLDQSKKWDRDKIKKWVLKKRHKI